MKKSIITIAAITASILFASCASIPEPSDKVSNLIYGTMEFSFENNTNANLLPDSDNNPYEVEYKIENRKTHKTYLIRANGKGELIRTNVPEGSYRLASFCKTIKGKASYDFPFEVVFNEQKDRYHFIVFPNGVTNLGHFKYSIVMNNVSSYSYSYSWDGGYEDVERNFNLLHADSDWNFKKWDYQTDSYVAKD